jgi:hypothetical protein
VSRISTAWNALLGRDVDEKAKPAAPAAPNTAQTEPYRPGMEVGRRGYDTDVPLGGATRMQPGGDYPDGRAAFMRSLYTAYTSCPWLAAPIDAIARTITAGGLVLEPTDQAEDDATPDNPPPSAAGLQNLLDYCNPDQDLVQLLRGGVTDAGIYGDAFVEVVWLLGAPVALFPLDPASMNVEADEHGNVTGYVQVYETLEQPFAPNEVIHVSMDSPKGSLYGMGIGQKALLPVTTWLFTMAALKETMRRGDPPHLLLDFPLEVQPPQITEWRGQYQTKNLGTQNIGNPITTRGGVTATELKSGSLEIYLQVLDSCRDAILSVAGVPPSKVGVIETGNIGGGSGESQDKTFRVNTCGPIATVFLEKLNYALTQKAFRIAGWALNFRAVDWRDDTVVEDIRDKRLRNGSWSLNDALTDLGKPTIGPEGDVHVLMAGNQILTWDVIAEMAQTALDQAKVNVDKAQASADAAAALAAAPAMHHPPPGQPGDKPDDPPTEQARTWRALVTEHYRRQVDQQAA